MSAASPTASSPLWVALARLAHSSSPPAAGLAPGRRALVLDVLRYVAELLDSGALAAESVREIIVFVALFHMTTHLREAEDAAERAIADVCRTIGARAATAAAAGSGSNNGLLDLFFEASTQSAWLHHQLVAAGGTDASAAPPPLPDAATDGSQRTQARLGDRLAKLGHLIRRRIPTDRTDHDFALHACNALGAAHLIAGGGGGAAPAVAAALGDAFRSVAAVHRRAYAETDRRRRHRPRRSSAPPLTLRRATKAAAVERRRRQQRDAVYFAAHAVMAHSAWGLLDCSAAAATSDGILRPEYDFLIDGFVVPRSAAARLRAVGPDAAAEVVLCAKAMAAAVPGKYGAADLDALLDAAAVDPWYAHRRREPADVDYLQHVGINIVYACRAAPFPSAVSAVLCGTRAVLVESIATAE